MRKGRSNRREDPRRHTLSGDHHSAATAAAAFNYQNNIAIDRSLDLEVRNLMPQVTICQFRSSSLNNIGMV